MLQAGAWKRVTLMVAAGALAILALAPAVTARDAWTTKSLTVWDDTSGCPGSLTVGASWDKKGGPIATVDFHLYAWNADFALWTLASDRLGVVPSAKDTASWTFSGFAPGSYTFTVEARNAKGLTLGLFNGTATNDPTVPC